MFHHAVASYTNEKGKIESRTLSFRGYYSCPWDRSQQADFFQMTIGIPEVGQEARWLLGPLLTLAARRKNQSPFSTSQPDIEEPAFFVLTAISVRHRILLE